MVFWSSKSWLSQTNRRVVNMFWIPAPRWWRSTALQMKWLLLFWTFWASWKWQRQNVFREEGLLRLTQLMSMVVTMTIWEVSVKEVNESSTLRSKGGGCEDRYWQGAAEEHITWQLCFYASMWLWFEVSAVITNIMKSARSQRVKADLEWKSIREPVSGNERVKADLKWKSDQGTCQWEWKG